MANYPGYPGYPGGYNLPPPPQRPGPPPSVITAVTLMYVGAALSFVGLGLGLLQRSAIRRLVLRRNPALTPTQINFTINVAIAFAVIVALVGVGLWLWMAYANKKGYSWARVVSTVFFGIDTLSLVYALLAGNTTLQRIHGVAVWLVALGAIVFLYRPDASAYFNLPP